MLHFSRRGDLLRELQRIKPEITEVHLDRILLDFDFDPDYFGPLPEQRVITLYAWGIQPEHKSKRDEFFATAAPWVIDLFQREKEAERVLIEKIKAEGAEKFFKFFMEKHFEISDQKLLDEILADFQWLSVQRGNENFDRTHLTEKIRTEYTVDAEIQEELCKFILEGWSRYLSTRALRDSWYAKAPGLGYEDLMSRQYRIYGIWK